MYKIEAVIELWEDKESQTMPDQPEKRETVSVEELALSNAYQLEAMINVLEQKGLLTRAEVLEELEVIAATMGKKKS
jgi:hypothetical protein